MDTQNQLIAAVKAGEVEQVSSLLEQDPSLVNARSANGSSAVVLATYYGHPEIARLLLAQGADPKARQSGGFTPLHSAAQNGQLDSFLPGFLIKFPTHSDENP